MGWFDGNKRNNNEGPRIYLGNEKIPVPRSIEPTGWLMLGVQGSGKTTAILNMVEQIKNSEDMLIFYDTKPDFFSRYMDNSNSIVFALGFDEKFNSKVFQIFNEIRSERDADFLADCLVIDTSPTPSAVSEHFAKQAKILMKAMLLTIKETRKEPSNIDLIDFLLENDTQDKFVKAIDTAGVAASYGIAVGSILTGNDGQSTSAWANFSKFANDLKRRELYRADGYGASEIIEYYESNRKQIQVFLLNPAADQNVFSTWCRLIIGCFSRAIRNLPNSFTRRIWIFADEFQTIGRFKELAEEFPAQARSKGGCTVLATQNLGKIDDVYGTALRSSILSGAATKLVFSVKDKLTQDECEFMLGQAEVQEITTSVHINPNGSRSITKSGRTKLEHAVLGSQIANQSPRCAYLKIHKFLFDVSFAKNQTPERFVFVPGEPPRFPIFSKNKEEAIAKEGKEEPNALLALAIAATKEEVEPSGEFYKF